MSGGPDNPNAPRSGSSSQEPSEALGSPQSLAEFEFQQNQQELSRNARQVEALNTKAENTLRLIGILFGILSSASLLVARLTIEESGFSFEPVLNEYIVLSLACLALAFILALLAYQKTDLRLYPSSNFFDKQRDEKNGLEEVYAQLNKRIPEWIQANSEQIEKDNTLLFNCQILIFFCLVYLLIGGLKIAYSFTILWLIGVLPLSIAFYWIIRKFVARDG